jgi:hypothetical protein
MDPAAESPDPVPPLPGWPFLPDAGASALIVGPTGGGRSTLVHSALYDSTLAGFASLYLGHEVIEVEFQARTASLAAKRGDPITDDLRRRLSQVRYVDLAETITRAFADPAGWRTGIVGRYRVVVIDPLSAVETALGLDFQSGGGDYLKFHDALIQPLVAAGVIVVALDNIGHAIDAKSRARGDSAKQDRADLAFACSTVASPPGLKIRATKVRSTRAGIRRDDAWIIDRDTQQFVRCNSAATDEDAEQQFRPTVLMERVSRTLENSPEPLGAKAIRKLVSGRGIHIDQAVKVLAGEGYIAISEAGYQSIRPFRTNPGVPHGVPDTVSPVSPVSPGVSHGVPVAPEGGVPSVHPLKGGHGTPPTDPGSEPANELWPRHKGHMA